jgi:hypothetical protein
MDEPLHPSSLSEILDRTVQIYRSRFLVFLGIAVVPTATLLAFVGIAVLVLLRWEPGRVGIASAEAAGGKALAIVAAFLFLVLPILLVVTATATAAMSHAASQATLARSIAIRESYRAAWRQGLRYSGIYVAQLVAVWVIPMGAWFVLLVFSASLAVLAQTLGLSGGPMFLLAGFVIVAGLVVFAFWMALRLALVFPASVVEQAGIWKSLRRSAALARGTKGRILLLYILGVALHWLLAIAITFPLTLGMALMPGANSPQHAQTAGVVLMFIVYGAAFAVQALTRPVYGIALTLFYYDQRIRKEGFDI